MKALYLYLKRIYIVEDNIFTFYINYYKYLKSKLVIYFYFHKSKFWNSNYHFYISRFGTKNIFIFEFNSMDHGILFAKFMNIYN